MAFSDLCQISNAYKTVENEPDQSERIMEENSMVRDLITKILDETGPSENSNPLQPQEKVNNQQSINSHFINSEHGNAAFLSQAYNNSYDMYNFTPNEQKSFNFNHISNGFGLPNEFGNYNEGDVNTLLGIDPVTETSADVTPEQLNLLRLAAQEIGGAQFTNHNKFDDKYYNFFDSANPKTTLPEQNLYTNNFNRPNSLNLDMNLNSNFDNFNSNQRFSNMKDQQDSSEILAYLSQLNLNLDMPREETAIQNNIDFKMPMDMNGHYQNDDFNKMQDRNKMFMNRNFQQMPPNKTFNNENNFYLNEVMKQMNDRNHVNHNLDYLNQSNPSSVNPMNFKLNGFHPQNDFMQRSDLNQMIQRENFPNNGPINEQRNNFENPMNRENMQHAAMIRQNQELARLSLLMRNRPPPNPLNVDVSFLHENPTFNLGLGALLAPNTSVPPPVLPSPMLDLPLLAPFYAMRNMRGAATSSAILHARLDACYEQWRQLERERKRTEARLALAYPGRAVSSSNSIPVPRLPPCPTRVDRLTVDMLREHTKVLTLMGKMETLRASVCVAQNKKPNKQEDPKITVLKRGQENLPSSSSSSESKDDGVDPVTFTPISWREDVKHLAEIAPHSEVESAMLSWRNAVALVQEARRRELTPQAHRYNNNTDPILQLSEAVKQLSVCARRARCAMWCDLTLTVALAPHASDIVLAEKSQQLPNLPTPITKQSTIECSSSNMQNSSKHHTNDVKEEKSSADSSTSKSENNNNAKATNNNIKQTDKQQDKNQQQRKTQNFRNKMNQGRNDFYQKNHRYDNRFMQSRHPYHYLATGPIN